jgi:putative transposase
MKRHPVRKNIRLPLPVYDQGHAFSITIATHGKHPWFRLHPSLCKAGIPIIRDSASALKIKIFAWCIMPDHVHFLLQGKGIFDFIRQFKRKLTPQARAAEPGRKLWQRSFFDHALRKEESLTDFACYNWENPVRAKIVEEPFDYAWSGSEVWINWRSFYGRG